jgi:hypothetical protein
LIDEALLGIFGDVHNGTFELGVSPVSITAKRFRNFSFVDSLLQRTYVAVIHQDHLVSVNPSEVIFHHLQKLVHKEVWMSMCAIFFTMILLGTVYEFVTNSNEMTAKSFLQDFVNWFFRILGTGLGIQGIGTQICVSQFVFP